MDFNIKKCFTSLGNEHFVVIFYITSSKQNITKSNWALSWNTHHSFTYMPIVVSTLWGIHKPLGEGGPKKSVSEIL